MVSILSVWRGPDKRIRNLDARSLRISTVTPVIPDAAGRLRCSGSREAHNRTVTEDTEQTRSVRPPLPPELVEPPAHAAGPRSTPDAVVPPTDAPDPAIADPGIADLPAPEPGVGPPADAPVEPPEEPADAADTAPHVGSEPADDLPDDGPREPRRPYRVKMTDGVVVTLDLTVYLGRRPSVPRIASDRRVRLVAVPSADKQVSATHLELRQSGDAVVATDMRSTNGSTVIVPGSKPRTLLRGESAVVTPGTLIDLGDGNVLELLSPERLTTESAARGDAGG
jgi:hypothetical protein